MKKILAFGASTSSTSINQQLAEFAAQHIQADTIDLRDFYPCAMYSTDEEKENGFPENAVKFFEKLKAYDGFVVSFAEHNGTYTAAFKNLFDWASRMGKVWNDKPLLVMGTSPGPRGAATMIEAAKNRMQWNGASEITGTFSLPSFQDNFSAETGITDDALLAELKEQLHKLEQAV
ncbi:MAG: NAD(P)H-dependent oxidoreductase [Saprospiraceae bacterium]|nr:NAD(P)H-dependent oxidoreductase [Saprospiraceae bacterium]